MTPIETPRLRLRPFARMARSAPLGPGSMSWKLHREIVLLAGWGRAILLQLAHPLVAQGVAEHSAFAAEPGGHLRRLKRTIDAMLALTFGDEDDAARAADGINRIHDRVHGVAVAGPTGGAPVPYSAHDPDLLSWVHLTLLDSFLIAYARFVAPLSDEERDRYCAESCRIGPVLGIPADRLPRGHAELARAVAERLAGGEIAVSETARALARRVLDPPVAWPIRPLLRLGRLPAIGLLPPAIREAYGFPWSRGQERALRALGSASRLVVPRLPSVLRDWPAARAAEARARESARS